MLDHIQEIKSIIFCEKYESIVNAIKSAAGIEIFQEYEDVMVAIDARRIALSGVSYKEIQEALNDGEGLLKFSINKLAKKDQDVEQEGYEPSVLVKCHGYSKAFLLINLVDLIVARRGSKELEQYFKSSRIPDWKNYAKEVLNFVP
ncbi:hypothetical protein [Pseudomonas sp. Fl4BN1]|uniref:hypothetical protein n=1 Tax=Pseudomonas sp. Fl4BN1 TaxID=2697651 RepID=UPI00137869BF|nr:hypothetical protein [Pseudomonas sp. Fl4BN1]NBF12636.1 hypothetical protein [Pseudomonas sp. Fl4BN1]